MNGTSASAARCLLGRLERTWRPPGRASASNETSAEPPLPVAATTSMWRGSTHPEQSCAVRTVPAGPCVLPVDRHGLRCPEPTHALAACIREALACKETGEPKVILTALCGHGLLDLPAYESYLGGRIVNEDLSDQALAAALATVPVVPS